uniref:Uncharacterized protein n=1 Tax=Ditylum brightwellii TaxID=49249 RepID=A0A7S4WE15_9STRA|mmetsp:Transcript_14212/g.19913  ORF Transcript_14212/g.19913 Transcript_14212/m.19913 type:complete len:119 (+) Transcript_14212:44-400(+)
MVTNKLFYDRNQRRNLPQHQNFHHKLDTLHSLSISPSSTAPVPSSTQPRPSDSFYFLLQLKHYSFYIIACHTHNAISQDVATVKYPTYHITATDSNSNGKIIHMHSTQPEVECNISGN